MFFDLSSLSSRPGSRNAAEEIGRSSMLDSDPRFVEGGGVVLTGVTVAVLVGDMIVIDNIPMDQGCLLAQRIDCKSAQTSGRTKST